MKRVLLPLILAFGVSAGVSAQNAVVVNAGAAAAPVPIGAAGPANTSYSATVPVAGTSDAQRNAAIANALSRVLRRVSPGFEASPEVLSRASGYVRDFRYRRAAAGGGLELQVDFDPGAVSRLVAANPGAAAIAGGATPAAGSTAANVALGGSGTLWVDGIDSSHAFATLLSTLRADAALHDVIPVEAEGDGVLLHLGFDQPLNAVLAGLTGPDGHLVMSTQLQPGADAALRWVP